MTDVSSAMLFGAVVVGAAAGSAGTALADRFDRPREFLAGRSRCRSCRRVLRWFELIPVISWLGQRGRCRGCSARIGFPTLGAELLAIAVSLLVATTTEPGFNWIWIWLSLVVASALIVTDLEAQILPDRLVWLLLVFVLGITWSTLTLPRDGLLLGLGSLVAGGLIYLIHRLSSGRAMGFGDVKLAAVLGIGLGWPLAGIFLWLAFVLGGVVGAGLLVTRRATRGQRIAFGPFLLAGYYLALTLGRELIDWLVY